MGSLIRRCSLRASLSHSPQYIYIFNNLKKILSFNDKNVIFSRVFYENENQPLHVENGG